MTDDDNILAAVHAISEDTPVEEIRAIYDRWAERYDVDLVEHNGYVMPERAASALAAAVADRDVSILDIGCGTGLSGLAVTTRGFHRIDGCDLSPGMLERAEQTGIYGRLFEANLLAPPVDVPDDHYDVAVACGVIAWGHLTPDVTLEMLRLVKPGGTLVLTVNDLYEHDGKLGAKLRELVSTGAIYLDSAEHGDHIPERKVGGWVYVMRKR